MKTYQPKAKEVKRFEHVIDAKGKVLGRLASQIAILLMGKNKAGYSAHMDCGDIVVVTNASQIVLTGKKKEQKIYRRHSNYPGGLKEVSFEKMFSQRPDMVILKAVDGMLPDNRLKDKRLRRLRVYSKERK